MKKLVLAAFLLLGIIGAGIQHTVAQEESAAGEAFTQEQIEELESMTQILPAVKGEMVIEKKPVAKPEYIYLDELPMSRDMQRWSQEKCKQYKVAYSFFLAFIGTESSYGTDTGNSSEVIGPMQISRCNWNKYKELDVFNDYDNVEIGIRMISELLQEYANTDMIIMGYKAGENRMLEMVAQGQRLGVCDTVVEIANYWEEKIEEARNE